MTRFFSYWRIRLIPNALLLVCSFALTVCCSEKGHAQTPPNVNGGVVILEVWFEGDTDSRMATGFLIDSDGLLVTADHVLRGVDQKPGEAYAPGQPPKKIVRLKIHTASEGDEAMEIPITGLKIAFGAPNDGNGIDVASVRIPLDSSQRSKFIPLDLALDLPVQGNGYWAAGPACPIDQRTETCFELKIPSATITTSTLGKKSYRVQADMIAGFSGGPLLNSAGLVIGVTSWGDHIGLTDAVHEATFTSVRSLIAFLSRADNMPQSIFLPTEQRSVS